MSKLIHSACQNPFHSFPVREALNVCLYWRYVTYVLLYTLTHRTPQILFAHLKTFSLRSNSQDPSLGGMLTQC